MPVNDLYEQTLFSLMGNQVAINRRYWKVANPIGTEATQAQMAAATDAAVATALKACMHTSATYKGSMFCRVLPIPRTISTITVTNTGPGTIATGAVLPRGVSGIITLRGFFAGKKFRGRIYVPFPGTSVEGTDGLPTGSYLGAMDTLGTALITTLVGVGSGGNTNDLQPVLARITYVNHEASSAVLTPLGSRIARQRWAQQHRRGEYGQPNVMPF
jgi:hypothetical protein